jgi:hypothetical protein
LIDPKFKYSRFSTNYIIKNGYAQKPGRPAINPEEHDKLRELDPEEYTGPYDALTKNFFSCRWRLPKLKQIILDKVIGVYVSPVDSALKKAMLKKISQA